ncbi:MAG: tRNA (guanosine(37)-N1)-methyltransferase TrmD [Patescibacteria group bacterium]
MKKPLKFEAISIFPESFDSYMSASILGRAQKKKLVSFKAHDLRKWTHDVHKTVDDKPFGGGPGMVMKPEPFFEALVDLKLFKKDGTRRKAPRPTPHAQRPRIIMTAANGKMFTHADAVRLSKCQRVVFLCGRYEGIDQRVIDRLCDESFCIGPYVLTGGELPAMVMMDAISRHIPGVLGKEASLEEESWSDNRSEERGARSEKSDLRSEPVPSASEGTYDLRPEYPQYTRPEVWLGMKVPEVLLSGNHKKIKEWREGMRKKS